MHSFCGLLLWYWYFHQFHKSRIFFVFLNNNIRIITYFITKRFLELFVCIRYYNTPEEERDLPGNHNPMCQAFPRVSSTRAYFYWTIKETKNQGCSNQFVSSCIWNLIRVSNLRFLWTIYIFLWTKIHLIHFTSFWKTGSGYNLIYSSLNLSKHLMYATTIQIITKRKKVT